MLGSFQWLHKSKKTNAFTLRTTMNFFSEVTTEILNSLYDEEIEFVDR